MLPELKTLVELQDLDREIKDVTQELERLPELLAAETDKLRELKEGYATFGQDLENLKSRRRSLESEMADMEEGIKKSRQRLMEIKSNIEHKAMLKEIAFKEDQRDKKETGILEIMDLMEAKTREIAEQDRKAKEQQAFLDQQQVYLKGQIKELKKQLASLEEVRRKLRKGVTAPMFKRYEFIRQRRNGTAVAPVREGVCLGCNMNVLPQQFIDLQKGEEILQCPHCQRMLYWLDELQGGEAVS